MSFKQPDNKRYKQPEQQLQQLQSQPQPMTFFGYQVPFLMYQSQPTVTQTIIVQTKNCRNCNTNILGSCHTLCDKCYAHKLKQQQQQQQQQLVPIVDTCGKIIGYQQRTQLCQKWGIPFQVGKRI